MILDSVEVRDEVDALAIDGATRADRDDDDEAHVVGAMSDAVMDAPVLMATRVCLGAKAKAEGERRGDITAKSRKWS